MIELTNGKTVSVQFQMPNYGAVVALKNSIAAAASESDVGTLLRGGTNLCSGMTFLEEAYPIMNKDFIAKKLFELKNKGELSGMSVGAFIAKVKEYAIVTIFNSSMTEYGKNVLETYSEDMGLEAECLDLYKNALNTAGTANVVSQLNGCSFDAYADIAERYRHLVYTNYITNNKITGVGKREEVLKNSQYNLGLTLDNVTEKIIGALAASKAATPEELMDAYNKAKSGQTTGGGSSSNGGQKSPGSSSPGGSSGGVYIPAVGNKSDDVAFFDDLSGSSWASEAINYLYENKIIYGKADRKFAPQDMLTREEAIAMLTRLFGLEPINGKTMSFADAEEDKWYYTSVKAAVDNGIVTGISEDMLGIGSLVTRQDFVTILTRAIITDSVINVYDVAEGSFTDIDEVSTYAVQPAKLCAGLGIITGYSDGSFRPNNPITRAEVAQILYNTLKIRR